MNLEIKADISKKDWEEFNLASVGATFLQSWNWGEFNEKIGRKIFRLGVYEGKKLAGVCLAVKYETKLGDYLYCPRGPVLDWKKPKVFQSILTEIKRLAKSEGAIFIKIDPSLEESSENRQIFSETGFVPAVTFVQVEDAWLLSLEKSEEDLLSAMRKTTRYLIRQGLKQEVKVEISEKSEDAKKFADLLYETASRKDFVNHPKSYYIKQFEILAAENQMRIFKAVKENKILAMAVVSFYADTAYYLHGASISQAGDAGYLLQWGIIQEAKRRNLKTYNFWGVVKDKHFYPSHPWYGFSLFKKGFGGYKYSYIRAQDLPLSPKYWIYRYSEKLRRLQNRIQKGYWED